MQDRGYQRGRRRTGRSGLLLAIASVTLVAVCLGTAALWDSYRLRTQMQNDPRVARVWTVAATFGPTHELKRGSALQEWLVRHNIGILGDYESVQGQYTTDPGSMEIWFNYESYVVGQPDLECHRVTPSGTAFVDDLGQPYHGFLDIHGKTVGVYLPGYDHSAHEMRCMLRWMPRRPAGPPPISRPMVFTVKLPRLARKLPPASQLPRRVVAAKSGVTVAIDAARLGPFKQANGAVGQRDLTFRVKIEGGDLDNYNVASTENVMSQGAPSTSENGGVLRFRFFASGRPLPVPSMSQIHGISGSDTPMSLTDPYGIPMLAPGQTITPLVTRETLRGERRGDGVVLVVPVNNAGKGTDTVRLHLDVAPRSQTRPGAPTVYGAPIPFDLDVPVQTGDEI